MTYSAPDIEELLQQIHDGRVTVEKLPEPLYFAIAEYLKRAIYEGFEVAVDDLLINRDYELIKELRNNIYRFSGAKTYQQVREMTDLLVGNNGVRSFREFKPLALEVFDKYNVTWLQAEYNTAIGQAQMASKWSEIVRNEDVLPYLRYDAIGDACPICKPLDGIIAPVHDHIWRSISPLNHFNCFCVLLQETKSVTPTDVNKRELALNGFKQVVSDDFNMNPYFDKVVFNSNHAYFSNIPKKDVNLAKSNFGLTIPEND